jgi:hypothetical protein
VTTAPIDIRAAVNEAVKVVNANAGKTCVHLQFAGDPIGLDFVANAATFQGGAFEFQAGFETYGGSVEELSGVRADVIAS